VGVVTKPFEFEGGPRMKNADAGLAELEANVDSLIVVLNEKLLEVLGDDISQDEAFAYANDVLKNAVGGIAEIINVPGHVNVDFEDVRTVMSEPGKAMMGTALAKGPDRARIAAEQAVACPLLEGIDLSGAKGVLVLITAAKGSLKLSESKLAMNTIRAYASSEAHVIYGTAYDDNLGDQVRVTVVATGLGRQGTHRRTAPPLQVLRTGTDNVPFNVPTLNNPLGASSGQRGSSTGPMASMGGMGGGTNMGASSAPQADYGSMSTPAVWRGTRTSAAQKVDALSSGGMDDYEIPAFLRKQAD
jgi:cell division protein FtsZ